MDTLRNMRIFTRVVESGSFTRAAELEALTTAQVSRALSDLEARLQTRLLNRTTRRMSLTEAGERYLQSCRRILAELERAEAEAAAAQANPSGTLRIFGGIGFGRQYVMPLIARYQARQPEVSIDLTISQQVPDIIEESFDLALVVAPGLHDSALISLHLGSIESVFCASPGYLQTHGTPVCADDLLRHRCLSLGDAGGLPAGHANPAGDAAHGPVRHTNGPTFQVNDAEALALAIRADMGIGVLPAPVALPALADGSLVRVLPGHTLPPLHLYALYASRRYLDAKIRTFVEFLREAVPVMLGEQRAALQAEEISRTGAAAARTHQAAAGDAREPERLRLVK